MWQWFSDFMGGVRFKNYIAPLADGTLIVEDEQHPVMKGVPASFVVPDDEWYIYDKSPVPDYDRNNRASCLRRVLCGYGKYLHSSLFRDQW